MSDDLYRRLARSGLAPFLEDVPDGPDFEDLTSDTILTKSAGAGRVPGWVVALTAGAAVSILIGATVVLLRGAPTSETGPTGTSFDSVDAAASGEAWWSAVVAGQFDEARAIAHPEAEFNLDGLREMLASLGAPVVVSVDTRVFGSAEQPQLCYTLAGPSGQQTGSLVFRPLDQSWLLWEVRSGTQRCVNEPAVTPTRPPPAPVEPIVSRLAVEEEIPLRVLAIRPNNPSLAVLDLEVGLTTIYPPGAHALPLDATDGAVMTPNREFVIWTNGVARLFAGSLDTVDVELGPTPPRQISGFAPALRVVPSPDGSRLWLVQPGLTTTSDTYPTLIELIETSTGRRLQGFETDGNAFPVAATKAGLVLNTKRLFNTGNEWITEPGSEHVLQRLEDGTAVEVGEGRAIAASSGVIIRLVCPSDQPGCDLYRSNNLVLSNPDGTDQRTVPQPFPGTWLSVGGPLIPSDAMPLHTVSPDGSRLVVGLGQTLDVNGVPDRSVLLTIDLADGTTNTIAEFDGATPLATWSSDGQWITLFQGDDIHLINATNPDTTITLAGVIPPDHFPLAAG